MSSAHTGFNIAFIGLDALAVPLAGRLIDSGVKVHGYDVNPAATADFEQAGVTASVYPVQAAANASVVLVMVESAEDVASVLFAPYTGAVYGLTDNATVILHSTVASSFTQDVRHRLDGEYGRADVAVIDAPILGSAKNAEDGTLKVMASAAKADHLERAEVKHILALMAQEVYHISGPLGSALKVKLLSQLLCGIHIVAAAEIMSLTAVIGLDTKRFYGDVVSQGAEPARTKNCWSRMFEDRVPKMLDEKLPLNSAIGSILNDVSIVKMEAARAGLQLGLCEMTRIVYVKAADLGLKEADDSLVLHAYLRRETDLDKTLQTISEMGGLFPEDETLRIAGLLANALAAIHAMAAYEALLFAEGLHMCRTLRQCKQWIEILGGSAAASTMFTKGIPRILESETHGTGSLELLVPSPGNLVESLRAVIDLAQDENQPLMLLPVAEVFFRQICEGKIKHHGRPILLVDAS